jgi:hypothetical protein
MKPSSIYSSEITRILCDNEGFEDMSPDMADMFVRSCAAYQFEIPQAFKRQKLGGSEAPELPPWVEVQSPGPQQLAGPSAETGIPPETATVPASEPPPSVGATSLEPQQDQTVVDQPPVVNADEDFVHVLTDPPQSEGEGFTGPVEDYTASPTLQKDSIEDYWPSDTGTYISEFLLRNDSAVTILKQKPSPFWKKCRDDPFPTDEEPFQFEGWSPSGERDFAVFEANPKLCVASVILASWLRDAGEPLDEFRQLSATCVLWGSIRHRVLWLTLNEDDAERRDRILTAPFGVQALAAPRPSVEGGSPEDKARSSLWALITMPEPAAPPGEIPSKGTIGWIRTSSGLPCVVDRQCIISGEEPFVGVQHAQASDPLDLVVGDLPGSILWERLVENCFDGRLFVRLYLVSHP